MRLVPSLVTAATLLAGPASAQDLYGHVFGGGSFLQDPTFSGIVTPPGGPQSIGTDFGSGNGLGITVGKSLPSLNFGQFKLRGEVELSYNSGGVDGLFFSGNGPAAEINVDGDISTTRVFANLIADLPTATALTPYAGLGLGIASTSTDLIYGPGVRLNDHSENLSAQLIVGGAYALNDRVSLTGDVRYIRDIGVEVPRLNAAGSLTGVARDDISSVNVNVGVRFGFLASVVRTELAKDVLNERDIDEKAARREWAWPRTVGARAIWANTTWCLGYYSKLSRPSFCSS